MGWFILTFHSSIATPLIILIFASVSVIFILLGNKYLTRAYLFLTGKVYVPVKELQNIWRNYDSARRSEEIIAVLQEQAERMVGEENITLKYFKIPAYFQKELLSIWKDFKVEDNFLLDESNISKYLFLLKQHLPGFPIPDKKFDIIYPLKTRTSWFGHFAITHKGYRKLLNKDYGDIFINISDQAASILEKGRILKFTRNQSDNLQKLLDLSKKISEELDLDKLLDRTMETLDEIIPFDAGGIFLIDDKYEYFYARKIKGYSRPDIQEINVKLETGIIGKAIREKRTIVLGDVKSDPSYYQLRNETNSQLTTPLFVGEEVIGVFSLESNTTDYFEAQDIDYLDAFGSIAAVSIRNAKLYRDSIIKNILESEMINAAQVQSALLPKNYSIPKGYDIFSVNIPSFQVGGDIFDLGGSDKDYLIAIGDVSGKGTSGAILMAVLFAGIRSTVNRQAKVSKNIQKLNNLMVESTIPGKYATFFMAKLDSTTDELSYTNAGHNPPLLFKKGKDIEKLEDGGIVLGFLKDTDFSQSTIKMTSGDIVVLYTDGLVEAMNKNEEEYDLERMVSVVQENAKKSSKEIAEALLTDVREWVKLIGLQDDLTMIVLKKK